jgi:hypothetical protein
VTGEFPHSSLIAIMGLCSTRAHARTRTGAGMLRTPAQARKKARGPVGEGKCRRASDGREGAGGKKGAGGSASE